VSKGSRFYPRVRVDGRGKGVVSQAGGVLLVRTARAAGLDEALSEAWAPWRKPTATHDPAKVLLELAVAVALGGDCLADIAVVRSAPAVFGLVASDPTVSRTLDALAAAGPVALRAVNQARAVARTGLAARREGRPPASEPGITWARGYDPLSVVVRNVSVA
jgi:hypothetical protein